MKIKPKYEVLAGIKQESYTIKVGETRRTYERWRAFCGTMNGKSIWIKRNTRAACIRAVNDWYAIKKTSGDETVSFTARQIADAKAAFRVMDEQGVTESLERIVMDYVKRRGEKSKSITVKDAYGRFYAKYGDQQAAQKEFVRGRVGRFAEKFGDRLVCDIDAQEIREYLDSFEGWSPSTWNGHMDYLKTFFCWCAKTANGYCAVNPIADMERKAVMRQKPKCATPEDVRRLFDKTMEMDEARRDLMLLRMTLAFFCGMRTAEILRQRFEDIMLDEGTIVVTEAKGEQSGGMGRAFKVPETAMAWLRKVDMAKAKATKMSETSYTRWRKILFDDAEVDMPDNAGRHSFVSYHVAMFGNPRLTEGIVGTGDTMRKRHYDARVTHKAAEEYFAILPKEDSHHNS